MITSTAALSFPLAAQARAASEGNSGGCMSGTEGEYQAFISYSHHDEEQASWLWKQLERYRVPARLVGSVSDYTPEQRKLTPIFKDRADLPASHSLRSEIQDALRNSKNLIVVCSPTAARSHWVNEEILEFKRIRGDDKNIFCLLVSGEKARDSFPPALQRKIGPDGKLTDEVADPLVADLRPGRDGLRLAKLKVAAGLIGVSLDALVQRDLQRRLRRVTAVTVLACCALIGVSILSVEAISARKEAERRRADAEGLIEFMLTDLRTRLDGVGRLDVLDSVADKAISYYEAQDLTKLSDDAVGRRARALHLLGKLDNDRGDLDAAEARFDAAYQSTSELLRRSPNDADRIYEHAQSAYWLGFIAYNSRDYAGAEEGFSAYRDLATRLSADTIGDPRGKVEGAYADTNLGVLFLSELGRADIAIEHFRSALVAKLELAESGAADRELWLAVATSHAWLADALAANGNLQQAMEERKDQDAIYQKLRAEQPDDFRLIRQQTGLAIAVARLQVADHQLTDALATLQDGAAAALVLTNRDPDNADWSEQAAVVHLELADCYIRSGELSLANAALWQAKILIEPLVDPEKPSPRHLIRLVLRKQLVEARLALLSDETGRALTLANDVIDAIGEVRSGQNTSNLQLFLLTLAHEVAGEAALKSNRSAAEHHWRAIQDLWKDHSLAQPPLERMVAESTLKMLRDG